MSLPEDLKTMYGGTYLSRYSHSTVRALIERIGRVESERDKASESYVSLTDELWEVFGAEDRRDYAQQARELMAENSQLANTLEIERDNGRNLLLQRDELKAERDALKEQQDDYQGRLWCALGQPVNVDFIEAVKELKDENASLKAQVERLSAPVSYEDGKRMHDYYLDNDNFADESTCEGDFGLTVERFIAARAGGE
jgi:FtsZ-binding cell division protein ZapB